MATINASELAQLRQRIAPDVVVNFTKQQVNLAIQAAETWFEKASTKNSLKADIDAATSPFTFTNAQANKIVKHWLQFKFGIS